MPHTLVFDKSARARIELTGAAAAATLNGLVTNEVSSLKPGQGAYAAALTAKGKIVADLIVLVLADRMLLDTGSAAAAGLREMLLKYVNPRFATQRDVTDSTGELRVVGDDAAAALARALGTSDEVLGALPTYSHVSVPMGDAEVVVVRMPAIGAQQWSTYAIIAPRGAMESVDAGLRSAGCTDGSIEAWERLRIESGFPEWGIDIDDNTLPQEANLDELHAVSYTKGCYIGQETVARVHFRGHVNRTLRRVSFSGDVTPPRGAALLECRATQCW